jgi:hypothetical protein
MNISKFLNSLKTRLNEYKERNKLTYFSSYDVYATEGQKYFKVFKSEKTETGAEQHRAIVAFIDKTTGDIFKPASFMAPAKHSRGNINSEHDGMEAINEMGFVHYLRG